MALTTKYVSINSVLSNIFNRPLMEGITEAQVAGYVADCISLIGAPMAYEDKVSVIPIENYRGEMPCNLLYIQQTRKVDSNNNLSPMRYSSDTFQTAFHEIGSPDFASKSTNYDYTYSINNGVIYTNFEKGALQQSYKALKTDTDGLPMIPDNVKFKKAVENYVIAEWYRIQWEMGKINDRVLHKAEQERDWYVGGANTTAQLMNIDQAETFRGAFTSLLNQSNAAQSYFQQFGKQEYIKYGSI